MDPWAGISDAAAALHRRALVFDAHADTLTEMTDRGYDLGAAPEGRHLDLPRCAGGVLDAQVFTCFVHPRYVGNGAAGRVRAMLDTLDRQLALFPDRLALCTARGEVAAARRAGRLAAVAAIEGGHAIEDRLELLQEFHVRGVRSMTLTWNNSNEWADGCGDAPRHGGLSPRGRQVVEAMEALGMLVDISHVAPSTFAQALEVARRPCVASHSCARALRDHPRNLADDQLRALAQCGGVACLNLYPVFLAEGGRAGLPEVVAHAERFLHAAGEDHVGLGCDYDGIDLVPEGLPDAGALPRLTDALLRRGWSERSVEKLLGANLLRVVEEALPARPSHAQAAECRA